MAKIVQVFGQVGTTKMTGRVAGGYTVEKSPARPDLAYQSEESATLSARTPNKSSARALDLIPVFRSVRGGPPMDHNGVDGVVEFEIPRGLLQVTDPQAFGYIVEGSSMEPEYPHGAIVIISPRDTVHNGDVCFVWFGPSRSWGKTIKEVVDAGDHWLLRAQNLNYDPVVEAIPKEEVSRIYPVVGVYKRKR